MMRNSFIALSAIVALWSVPAYAHHNGAAHYLTDKYVTVEGTVTEFRLINPHARIYFDVKTADGKVESWMSEGDAASVLRRRGWTAGKLKKGDVIKLTGHPSRDGKNLIEWTSIILSDGTEIGGGNGLPDERQRHLEDLEKRRKAASQ